MNQFNLLGEIVADDSQKWFSSDVVPAMVIGWLAKQDGDVEININSPGGDVAAGLAIANALKGYKKGKVSANVLGIAASMASVIACACDELRMGKGSFIMIHNPWGMVVGEADDLRHQADVMDKMKDSIVAFYQTKFDKDADEIASMMDAETWIAAEDALDFGLSASPYAEEFKVAACATRRSFDHAPDGARGFFAFRERPAEPEAQAVAEQPAQVEDNVQEPAAPVAPAETKDDWEARYRGLSKKMTEKADEIASLRAQLDGMTNTAEEARNALESVRGDLTAAQAQVKDLDSQLRAVRGDLEKAKADLSSAVSRAENAEKDLALKGEQLDRMTKAHALLTGGVLTPGDGSAYEAKMAEAKTPQEREKLRALKKAGKI